MCVKRGVAGSTVKCEATSDKFQSKCRVALLDQSVFTLSTVVQLTPQPKDTHVILFHISLTCAGCSPMDIPKITLQSHTHK